MIENSHQYVHLRINITNNLTHKDQYSFRLNSTQHHPSNLKPNPMLMNTSISKYTWTSIAPYHPYYQWYWKKYKKRNKDDGFLKSRTDHSLLKYTIQSQLNSTTTKTKQTMSIQIQKQNPLNIYYFHQQRELYAKITNQHMIARLSYHQNIHIDPTGLRSVTTHYHHQYPKISRTG